MVDYSQWLYLQHMSSSIGRFIFDKLWLIMVGMVDYDGENHCSSIGGFSLH